MDLQISGYSTALYSTYWMVEPLGILFDCGDGAASFFRQKGRSVHLIACSHPDRDHLAGLPQFLQLNSQPGSPRVLYPAGSGSFPALRDFIARFDAHAIGCEWEAVDGGDRIEVRKDWFLECYENRHLARSEKGPVKSLSYSLVEERRKLRPEWHGVPGAELGRIREEKGEDAISEVVTDTVLTYAADTPLEEASFWRDPRILIHEATFLTREEATSRDQTARHSVLGEVIEMASRMPTLERLILGHFSCRYDKGDIRRALVEEAERVQFRVPIHAVFPGEARLHLTDGTPVWPGC